MPIYTFDQKWWSITKKEVIKDAFDIKVAVQNTLFGLFAKPTTEKNPAPKPHINSLKPTHNKE